jgi:hypothetical protein
MDLKPDLEAVEGINISCLGWVLNPDSSAVQPDYNTPSQHMINQNIFQGHLNPAKRLSV